jgi:hypothetical protein
MIEQFATSFRILPSELLDLNQTIKIMVSVSLLIPKFAPHTSSEVRRTSESGH